MSFFTVTDPNNQYTVYSNLSFSTQDPEREFRCILHSYQVRDHRLWREEDNQWTIHSWDYRTPPPLSLSLSLQYPFEMTSPLTGTQTHESDPLPPELSAKSPKKESAESNKSRERKVNSLIYHTLPTVSLGRALMSTRTWTHGGAQRMKKHSRIWRRWVIAPPPPLPLLIPFPFSVSSRYDYAWKRWDGNREFGMECYEGEARTIKEKWVTKSINSDNFSSIKGKRREVHSVLYSNLVLLHLLFAILSIPIVHLLNPHLLLFLPFPFNHIVLLPSFLLPLRLLPLSLLFSINRMRRLQSIIKLFVLNVQWWTKRRYPECRLRPFQ